MEQRFFDHVRKVRCKIHERVQRHGPAYASMATVTISVYGIDVDLVGQGTALRTTEARRLAMAGPAVQRIPEPCAMHKVGAHRDDVSQGI
jgi:hypothetical protein